MPVCLAVCLFWFLLQALRNILAHIRWQAGKSDHDITLRDLVVLDDSMSQLGSWIFVDLCGISRVCIFAGGWTQNRCKYSLFNV